MIKKLLFFILLAGVTSFCKAQKSVSADSSYIFNFVQGRNMFYVPYKGNKQALTRLLGIIDRYREDILSGKIIVSVDGYCTDLRLAKTRSNRVKTEMILKGGLMEQCFSTTNHREKGDYVKVTLPLLLIEEGQGIVADESTGKETLLTDTANITNEADSVPATTLNPSSIRRGVVGNTFSLRTNILRWATLTADLRVEYRIRDTWGILINGTFANWGWKDKTRRYKVWKVSPEVRCYMGKGKRGFLGAMYHTGEFNYKLGETGKTGDYQGGGITGGYMLPLTGALSLELHEALGCTRADYEKYVRIGEVNVRRGNEVKNYWGINQLGVSLVWKW